MWPTQFMSKAFRRISFVISQFPGLGGCSASANVAGLGAGRDAELQRAVRARGCVSRRRARYGKVNDQATAAGWHLAPMFADVLGCPLTKRGEGDEVLSALRRTRSAPFTAGRGQLPSVSARIGSASTSALAGSARN